MPEQAVKLVNMKLDPKKVEERMKPKSITEDAPVYPWGLRLNLDEDSLDALKITKMPKIGDTLYLGANVKIVGVADNEHTSEDGGTHRHRSVELQITDMGLTNEPAEKDTELIGTLYKGGNGDQPLYNPKDSITLA